MNIIKNKIAVNTSLDSSTPLFHATRQKFSTGQVIPATTVTSYYPDVIALLEQHRPHNFPSRSICVFAAENSAASLKFLMSQNAHNAEEIRLYQVQMDIYHRAPFRVIHELHNRIKSSESTDKLVTEYWQPKHTWAFWEYFGPSFKVVEEIAHPNLVDICAFGLSYDKDVEFSKTL